MGGWVKVKNTTWHYVRGWVGGSKWKTLRLCTTLWYVCILNLDSPKVDKLISPQWSSQPCKTVRYILAMRLLLMTHFARAWRKLCWRLYAINARSHYPRMLKCCTTGGLFINGSEPRCWTWKTYWKLSVTRGLVKLWALSIITKQQRSTNAFSKMVTWARLPS